MTVVTNHQALIIGAFHYHGVSKMYYSKDVLMTSANCMGIIHCHMVKDFPHFYISFPIMCRETQCRLFGKALKNIGDIARDTNIELT